MTFQTFTGRQYLMIDVASNLGLDKEDWDVRLEWFHQNEHQLESLVNQAKEPALYYAGVSAYRSVQNNQPIGYPISLDATSSGLQILAALTGDRSAAALCNVVDTGHREDAYTIIHRAMVSTVGVGANITRDQAKDAIMTSLYGSTAMPKEIFGEGELLQVFNNTMGDLAPFPWELNHAMLEFWDPTALTYDWVMPDNFHVHTKVMNTVKETVLVMGEPFQVSYKVNSPVAHGRSLCANMTHAIDGLIVREMTARCDYDPAVIDQLKAALKQPELFGNRASTPDDHLVLTLWNHYQQSGYLSARILPYLKTENLGHVDRTVIDEVIQSLPLKPFKVISVHDCFRCLPHYGNDLRRQYNIQLAMIAKSNLLSWLLGQILNRPIQIQKADPNLYLDIFEANYALS